MRAELSELGVGSLAAFDLATVSPLAWVSGLCLVAYWAGVVSLWRRNKHWNLGSALSFTAGCVAWFAATGLAVNGFAMELVSALLFQQITLLVVVPPLLLMGAPGRLLLRSAPRVGAGRAARRLALIGYRARLTHHLLNPVVAIAVTALALPALYFSDVISSVLSMPGGHTLLLTVVLVLGVVAAAPLWSLDPLPRSPSYVARIVGVVVEIQIHAVFGLILLLSTRPLFQWYSDEPERWGISRALDQAIGGGLIWSYGELPLLIVLIVTLSKWRRRDERRAKQREVQEDADLDAYNAYLAERNR